MRHTPYSVLIQCKGCNPIVGETTYRLAQARKRLQYESQINDGRIVDIMTAQGIIIASNIPERLPTRTSSD